MNDTRRDGVGLEERERLEQGERALVVVPDVRTPKSAETGVPLRDLSGRREEAIGLAAAIDLTVVDAVAVPITAFRPATLLGTGKVDEIAGRVRDERIGLVIVDHPLSPVQQRNLERAWAAKVIDRTGLILEIFGERAETREGRLQVELAHLNYQKGRLVRSWTHLERQRGGFGFLGGPGETQIEADRRAIETRIARIERDLQRIVARRRLHRRGRRRSRHAVVALVGYTNAGKSTLFNRLTDADRYAADKLFATLDPTLRQFTLPDGRHAILSDTVGFVSDLPTDLVAAFRATLEEVVEADLILHVRDIAHPDTEAQAGDVRAVLKQLGIDPHEPGRIVEVWNKIDLIDDGMRPATDAGTPDAVAVSAVTGEGIGRLLQVIASHLGSSGGTYRIRLAGERLGLLHRVYAAGEVLAREDHADGSVELLVRVPAAAEAEIRRIDPDARLGG